MKEYNLHFYTTTPCAIYINGQYVGNIDNVENYFIDIITTNKSLILTAEPINNVSNNYSATTIKLVLDNTQINDNIKMIPFTLNNYDIIISLNKNNPVTPLINVLNKSFNNYKIEMFNSNDTYISIFNKETEIFNFQTSILNDINYNVYDNNIFISGTNSNNETFILIFNKLNDKIIIKDYFMQYEIENNIFKGLKYLNTFYKHGKVTTYNFETNLLDSYYVYLPYNNKIDLEDELIPYAFMESIQTKDFNNAKALLSANLNNSPNEKLEQFFNGIIEIYLNSYYFKDNKFNYTVLTTKGYKNYTFSIKNKKINEIEEELL